MAKANVLLTDKVVKELDKMIRRIAWTKKDTVVIEFDDLVNELWLKALNVIEKKGEIDYNYIAKACFYCIVDIVRKNVKDESFPCSNERFDYCVTREQYNSKSSDHSSDNVYDYATINGRRFEEATERIELEDILNLFDPKDEEKERLYVKTWMDILGLSENIEHPEKLPEKAYDRYIAVEVLHYAGSGSGGYMKLRNKVRERLIENGYRIFNK